MTNMHFMGNMKQRTETWIPQTGDSNLGWGEDKILDQLLFGLWELKIMFLDLRAVYMINI
jgi:hypothetical protein